MKWLLIVLLLLAGCTEVKTHSDPWPSSSETYLLPSDGVVVEVSYAGEWVPSDKAMDDFEEVFEWARAADDVHVLEPKAFHAPMKRWSAASLIKRHLEIARANDGENFATNGTGYMHIMYVPGEYAEMNVLGVAFLHIPFVVIFPDQIPERIGPIFMYGGNWEKLKAAQESRTLRHELGHMLGLVDCGVPDLAERPYGDGTCHSSDERSIMYGEYDWIQQDLPPPHWTGFTPDDIRDLRAFQESHGYFVDPESS